jgi:hypothetical protein
MKQLSATVRNLDNWHYTWLCIRVCSKNGHRNTLLSSIDSFVDFGKKRTATWLKKDAALRNGVWTFGLAFSAGNCPPNHTNLQLCTFLVGYPPLCYEFGLEQSYRFAPCHFLFNIPSFRSFLGYGFVSY